MQMDELTQQNAALVEQATAASQAMAEQVRGLNQMLDRYRVNDMIESAKSFAAPASAAATPRSAARVERRSSQRPWADRPKAGAAVAAGTARKRTNGAHLASVAPAAEAQSDNEWREF
jgi:methyl-accepting chemotaxis protein